MNRIKKIIRLFYFFIIIIICNCVNNDKRDINSIIVQEYCINNKIDTTIICEKGTKLFIPNNVFDCDSMSSSKLSIEVLELYDLKDILTQNIITISDNELLETFGMVKINVSSDGKKLKLAENKELIVSFPSKYYSDKVEIFYGNTINGQVEWEIGYPCQNYPKNVYLNYVNKMKSNFVSYKGPGTFLIVNNINFTDHFLCNFDFQETDYLNSGCFFYFAINKLNRIKNVIVEYCEDENFNGKLVRFIYDLENYNLEYNNCDTIGGLIYVSGVIIFDRVGYDDLFFSDTLNNEMINYYSFKLRKLGWLNVDKFIEFQDSIDISLNMVYNPNIECKIVLKDPRCVVQAVKSDDNKFIFINLPKNKKALLYVERIKGKKVYYYIDTLNTNIEKIGSFKLQRFSKERYNKDMEIVRNFWDTK